jgi:beta-phosphoglucomutase-like phosphatase (HAD superfamily)
MDAVETIVFEPVGCLAEFPAEPFNEIGVRFFGGKRNASKSGSRAYWHLLNLMQMSGKTLGEAENQIVEALEAEAVAGATIYEDVFPALSELKAMGVEVNIASSLSKAAVESFLGKIALGDIFSAVWNRDTAEGIKDAPLHRASFRPDRAMFLTDTAEGLKVAKSAGFNVVLMMNDPDEARRLAMQEPAGGIVSLLELPDFVRLLAARNPIASTGDHGK